MTRVCAKAAALSLGLSHGGSNPTQAAFGTKGVFDIFKKMPQGKKIPIRMFATCPEPLLANPRVSGAGCAS